MIVIMYKEQLTFTHTLPCILKGRTTKYNQV